MTQRFRATPWGVAVDRLDAAGQPFYTEYLADSLPPPPPRPAPPPWTWIVAAGLLIVQIGLLVVYIVMFEYVRGIADGLLAVA